MQIVYLILRLVLVGLCLCGLYNYLQIYKEDKTKLNIGFIHYLEVGLYIALLIISLLTVSNSSYDLIVISIIVITIILMYTLKYRLVLIQCQ